MRLRLPVLTTLLAAALTLSACGGGSSDAGSEEGGGSDRPTTTDAPASGDPTTGTEVAIVDFAFDPADLEVKVGDTVTFTNGDSATHTATSDDDAPTSFDTGEVEGDSSAEVTFDEAGDYSYYCFIHDYMTGTVRVLE